MKGLDESQTAELLALWYSFNTNSLNIPSIRPTSMVKYSSSLIGKDFRIILQAAPFLFFRFMDSSHINLWSSLCHLGSLIFQTHIDNMPTYISQLKNQIDIFLNHLVQDSAQWTNKPKFHMLLHLPESILQYGPTSLFATEKFESYNGILRNASIHSNRQSPGQDIAITFSNYHTFRQLISGGFFFDKQQQKYIKSSTQVTNVFATNPLVQQSLGYNQSASIQELNYPLVKNSSVPAGDQIETPQDLKNYYPGHEITQLLEIHFNEKQVLKKNYFIMLYYFSPIPHVVFTSDQYSPSFIQFNATQPQHLQHIGCINSIWLVQSPSHQSSYYVYTSMLQMGDESSFYKMRKIQRTPQATFVNTSVSYLFPFQ